MFRHLIDIYFQIRVKFLISYNVTTRTSFIVLQHLLSIAIFPYFINYFINFHIITQETAKHNKSRIVSYRMSHFWRIPCWLNLFSHDISQAKRPVAEHKRYNLYMMTWWWQKRFRVSKEAMHSKQEKTKQITQQSVFTLLSCSRNHGYQHRIT